MVRFRVGWARAAFQPDGQDFAYTPLKALEYLCKRHRPRFKRFPAGKACKLLQVFKSGQICLSPLPRLHGNGIDRDTVLFYGLGHFLLRALAFGIVMTVGKGDNHTAKGKVRVHAPPELLAGAHESVMEQSFVVHQPEPGEGLV